LGRLTLSIQADFAVFIKRNVQFGWLRVSHIGEAAILRESEIVLRTLLIFRSAIRLALFATRNCEPVEQAQAPFDALSLPMSWIRKQSVLDAEQTFLRESRSKT
jgi:hypothetical protein